MSRAGTGTGEAAFTSAPIDPFIIMTVQSGSMRMPPLVRISSTRLIETTSNSTAAGD